MQVHKLIALIISIIILASCSSGEDDNAQVRAIKTITIEGALGGQNRRISGVVESAQRADLSFEIPGRVATVPVKLGTPVQAGQPLATLDAQPYQLAVDSATAELTKSQAILMDKKTDYTSKNKLYEDGRYVAKTVVDTAYADYQAAEQNVNSAKAKLELATRDLAHTVLTAPYTGEVAAIYVDPANNVASGQVVMELLGEGGMEVALALPEALRAKTQIGMPVSIIFPSLNNAKTTGHVSEIAARATEGNAFSVKIAIENIEGVYAGLTAEVLFTYAGSDENVVYLVPAVSIAPPESDNEDGFIYVYQPEAGTVLKTPVKLRGLQGTQVEITDGVQPGDIIAIAGVHFLNDGQKVKLMQDN